MNRVTKSIDSWKSKGQYFDYQGHRIWYIDINNHCEKVLCILHGYPTCSYDYKHLLGRFEGWRVIVHDHLGFGLSDKPTESTYLLSEQADIALTLYENLGVKSFVLFAHDYGTSIATEILARDNSNIINSDLEKIILCNGSMLIDLSQLRPIQKMLKNKFIGPIVARLATRNTFIRNMHNIWCDSSDLNNDDLKILWQLLVSNGGRKVLPKITRYIDQRYEYYDKWIGALKETQKKVLILWAENDPVAVIEMANVLEKYIPNSQKVTIPDTGHYPMIENPNAFVQAINNFIK